MPVVRVQSVYNTSPADTGAAYTVGQPPTLPCRGVFRWSLSICKCGASHRLKEWTIYSKRCHWTGMDIKHAANYLKHPLHAMDNMSFLRTQVTSTHGSTAETTCAYLQGMSYCCSHGHFIMFCKQDGDVMAKNSKSTWCHMVILLLHN